MCNLFGVTLFHTSIVQLEWGGMMYPQYMCILLYVIDIWCKWYFIDLLSIGVGVDVSSVYVHSAICDTYLV